MERPGHGLDDSRHYFVVGAQHVVEQVFHLVHVLVAEEEQPFVSQHCVASRCVERSYLVVISDRILEGVDELHPCRLIEAVVHSDSPAASRSAIFASRFRRECSTFSP